MQEVIMALSLLEILIPKIDAAVKRGEVSPEQQEEVHAKYLQLRALADAAFSGPEWEIEG